MNQDIKFFSIACMIFFAMGFFAIGYGLGKSSCSCIPEYASDYLNNPEYHIDTTITIHDTDTVETYKFVKR